jgi:hypothetical protein
MKEIYLIYKSPKSTRNPVPGEYVYGAEKASCLCGNHGGGVVDRMSTHTLFPGFEVVRILNLPPGVDYAAVVSSVNRVFRLNYEKHVAECENQDTAREEYFRKRLANKEKLQRDLEKKRAELKSTTDCLIMKQVQAGYNVQAIYEHPTGGDHRCHGQVMVVVQHTEMMMDYETEDYPTESTWDEINIFTGGNLVDAAEELVNKMNPEGMMIISMLDPNGRDYGDADLTQKFLNLVSVLHDIKGIKYDIDTLDTSIACLEYDIVSIDTQIGFTAGKTPKTSDEASKALQDAKDALFAEMLVIDSFDDQIREWRRNNKSDF